MKYSKFGAAFRQMVSMMNAEERRQILESMEEYRKQCPKDSAAVDHCEKSFLEIWAENPVDKTETRN